MVPDWQERLKPGAIHLREKRSRCCGCIELSDEVSVDKSYGARTCERREPGGTGGLGVPLTARSKEGAMVDFLGEGKREGAKDGAPFFFPGVEVETLLAVPEVTTNNSTWRQWVLPRPVALN